MDTDDTTRWNIPSPSSMTSTENANRPPVRKQVFWGGIIGAVIGANIVFVKTLLLQPVVEPQSGIRWWLIGLAEVVVSLTLGIVLLVILRPKLRKAAGLAAKEREPTKGDQK